MRLEPAAAAQRIERRARLAGPDVLAHQVRLGHRHIELRRRLRRVAGRIFYDQAFLPRVGCRRGPLGRLGPRAQRQHLQAGVPPNAVLQMNHIIPLLQVRKINVQG